MILNPSRRSHREQFYKHLDELIEVYKLEEQAINLGRYSIKEDIE